MTKGSRRRILAVRHGESEWNVLRRAHPSEDERYHPRMHKVDCSVTVLGKQQGKEAGVALAKEFPSVDLFLISPLRRALQTASYILESYPSAPRVQINKDATEIMLDPCDIGSPPTVLAAEFPDWDFSNLEDCWWYGGKSPDETLEWMTQRQGLEIEEQTEKRIACMKAYLRERKESTIVVVCHSETIWWLTSEVKNGERFGTWSKNGEILDITRHIQFDKA
jgi:broad specificity phosphatase PhoE